MTAPTTSRIPALLTGIYNAAFAKLGATASVVFGPPLQWFPTIELPPPGATSENAFLFIGAHPDDDISVQPSPQKRTTLGTGRSEDMNPVCTAIARNDESSMQAACTAAFALVGTLEQAIRADQTFNAAAATSLLSVDDYRQVQQEDGAVALVVVTITGRAFLR